MDWEERVLPSIGNEVVKAVVAQYNAEQLLTQREKVGGVLRGLLGSEWVGEGCHPIGCTNSEWCIVRSGLGLR
jgi:hypothetical protein